MAAQVLLFVGVTASASSINRVFPAWSEALGLADAVLEPVDLPLDVSTDGYRAVVRRIREEPGCRGALVTTHKVRLLDAAGDLVDELDPLSRRLGEVSCLAARDGRLHGSAKDPLTAGRALADAMRPERLATPAEVACLGAGGAGAAIALHLQQRPPAERPARVVLCDRDPARLEHCRELLDSGDPGPGVGPATDYQRVADAAAADSVVAALPPGSMVVNATGLGKDRPGSPLTDAADFPSDGIAWDLNYRGDLDFLRQARARAAERRLQVIDGWRYFIHGWSAVIAEVFGIELSPALMDELSELAARAP